MQPAKLQPAARFKPSKSLINLFMSPAKKSVREIYCDHSATTPLDPGVLKLMQPFFTQHFGNASALHARGTNAKKTLEAARLRVARILECDPAEIIFTSGGTESDNLALKGIAEAYGAPHTRSRRGHIITTQIEHHANLHTCQYLEKQGFKITYLPVNADGLVDPETVRKAIRKNTLLVSIMYANNEIGTVQPLAQIAKICQAKNIPFHTDAVQAPGLLPLSVKKLGVDLLSLSAHKFYGPQGVGLLYIRSGLRLQTQNLGGSQESGRRASTENLAGIAGLSFALEKAEKKRASETKRLQKLRDNFVKQVLKQIPDTKYNGHKTKRLTNNAHFCFAGLEGESLLLRLDEAGIRISSTSACASSSLEPSHVLQALGLPPVLAHGSARFTFGALTTASDITRILQVLPKVVHTLRDMSPIYEPGLLQRFIK